MLAEGSLFRTRCCIAGGGPAGMMLGYLLARSGIETTVLEKHADFLRDFRGDTVHPSTLRVLDDLGLLDAFLRRPHRRLRRLEGWFGAERVQLADFGGLPARYAFIAMMPQWEFLDFLATEAQRLPAFTLLREARVDALRFDDGQRVVGVSGHRQGADAPFALEAELTIGCDGRHSTVREAAGLPREDIGAPIDVLWFRVARDPADTDSSFARVAPGRFLVTIDRGDYWQCAFVVPKGGAERLQQQDIEVFRRQVREAAAFLGPQLQALRGWGDVKLLSVRIDRLRRWSCPGLLCIGDAAHAMSPVGGVGINLAIQDAVATANLLVPKLRTGGVDAHDLDAVRRRRQWPTRATQAMQQLIQNEVLLPTLDATGPVAPPLPMRLVSRLPPLQRLFARLLGMGVRPERIEPTAAG